MDSLLRECIDSEENSYIFPFLWMSEQTKEEIYEEILAIKNAGIKEFCIESRTHNEFIKEKWWEDFGYVLEIAKENDMKVWLLDDKHFPTGFAGGALEELDDYSRVLLKEFHIDVVGPAPDSAMTLPDYIKQQNIISVVAYKCSGTGDELIGEGIDLTGNLEDGLLWFDIPEGMWRVFYIVIEYDKELKYVDFLNLDSCKKQLEYVYESHFERFSKYFGNTFRGFFSDEPQFYNDNFTYFGILGRKVDRHSMRLPWAVGFEADIAEQSTISEKIMKKFLPALWYDVGEKTAEVRIAYMDAVTKKYRENFPELLGSWCRDHNVMYIGHVIEDSNTHMRLCGGTGHYFRAMSGQDMSGVDVVLHQIMPGFTDMKHTGNNADYYPADAAFFNYTLAKLASSDAHTDQRKKNRAMCEVFGAYGWAEGLPVMKYLADHMLVCGINRFVPHAFSSIYPNPDCPPHFYVKGNYPHYKLFGSLMKYMARSAHILSIGTHIASVALFYNAEAEWSGGRYSHMQTVAKRLTQNQIDFDIVSVDALVDSQVNGGEIQINNEYYKALIIPYSSRLSVESIKIIKNLSLSGLRVIFLDGYPSEFIPDENCDLVETDEISDYLRQNDMYEITLSKRLPLIRYYHVRDNKRDVFMFMNDDIHNDAEFVVNASFEGDYIIYDAWKNNIYRAEKQGDGIILQIPKRGALFLLNSENEGLPLYPKYSQEESLDLLYKIELKEKETEEYEVYRENSQLINISRCDGLSHFCGYIRYTSEFYIDSTEYSAIDLGVVGETATVRINGQELGSMISEPYIFEIGSTLKTGKNVIEVEVVNNMAYRIRDNQSCYMQLPPSGLMGPVVLKK